MFLEAARDETLRSSSCRHSASTLVPIFQAVTQASITWGNTVKAELLKNRWHILKAVFLSR